jgi:tetratricopeptide (TPR) repeat protein
MEASDCSTAGAPPPVAGSAAAGAVDSLLEAGSRAAILGDHYTAGALLSEAASLDPGNAVVAYRLARTYEERGEAELAATEYCRYLAIAPEASDSADVRQRIQVLASRAGEADRDELSAAMRAGLEAYQRRRYEAAILAFERALEIRPTWASAYFNRGAARLMLRRQDEAVTDFERYLELRPGAEDRGAVVAQIDSLRSRPTTPARIRAPAPGGVLLQGLVVPGLGQFATGRPLAGMLVLTGAAGAVYFALQESYVVRTRIGVDPFGNPYEFQDRTLERTHLVEGVSAGAALMIASAVEAYVHARGRRSRVGAARSMSNRPAWLHVQAAPDLSGVDVGFRLRH